MPFACTDFDRLLRHRIAAAKLPAKVWELRDEGIYFIAELVETDDGAALREFENVQRMSGQSALQRRPSPTYTMECCCYN